MDQIFENFAIPVKELTIQQFYSKKCLTTILKKQSKKKFHLFFTFPRINDKHNIIDCYTRMYN